ncbi:DUF2147 domain-containing protein [Lentibacter sp. XHP0401]|uniref:DUF2147 domain-containing protein n=1 Tax=Lentibacter sp. XHP0401 TaxID=2984334 RepID=UPI0021E88EF7|nr:DUF2147 domain-containing protein [Lentibacter sp. XHP0401]MCV2893330.1 DUF2147 domain-containing protein [Lentibacter sp. XHP0401]
MRHTLFLAVAFALAAPVAVQANSAKGLWQTEPDDKGQTGIVSVAPCGKTLCGTIIKAYDAQNRAVVTPNVGKRILFDMIETKPDFYEGRVLIPKFNRTLEGKMMVQGARMKLSGCVGAVCGKQTWTRTK